MEENRNLYDALFSKANSDVLNQLLHACADEICCYPGPSYERFSNNVDWSKNEYDIVHKLLSSLLENPAVLYLDEEKMPQEYHELPKELQCNLMTCLKVRREQLVNALLKRHSKICSLTFMDFNWRLKLLLGSSKMASLREPLLQLDLKIQDNNDDQRTLGVELNRDELDTLITSLEAVVR